MDWIRKDCLNIQQSGTVFPTQTLETLNALHIDTAEDLLVLWKMGGVRDVLIQNLQMDPDEFAGLMAQLETDQHLNRAYLDPLDKGLLENFGYGLQEPEKADSQKERQPVEESKSSQVRMEKQEVDFRDFLQPVQNQGSRGTCVGFGTTVVREFLLRNSKTKLSEQYLYWGAKMRDGNENSAGTRIQYAVKCLEEEGISTAKTWPYHPKPGASEHQGPPPEAAQNEAEKYKILKGVQLNCTSVDSLKAVLAGNAELDEKGADPAGRIISFGIPVFKSWYQNPITFKSGRIPMPLPNEPHVGGHCMTLVGYKEDESWPGGGYFILRNSWGTQWASESDYGPGYGQIPYKFLEKYGWEAWTMKVDPVDESYIKAGRGLSVKNVLWGLLLALVLVSGILYFSSSDKQADSSQPSQGTHTTQTDQEQTGDDGGQSASNPDNTADSTGSSDGDPDNSEKVTSETENTESDPQAAQATGNANSEGSNELDSKEDQDTGQESNQTLSQEQGDGPLALAAQFSWAGEEEKWQQLVKQELNPEMLATYPHSDCVREKASKNGLSAALVMGLAAYLSNYDPGMVMDKRYGILQLGWPGPHKKWGIEKKEQLITEPCLNIEKGCAFLASQVTKSNGLLVPALAAFRRQIDGMLSEDINDRDIRFAANTRKYAQKILSEPFTAATPELFLYYDKKRNAQDFIDFMEEKTGIQLWLSRPGYKYAVSVMAKNDEDRQKQVDRIRESTGLKPQQE